MKALILAAVVALTLGATTASAAPPADVMAAQINTLKRQVSGLTLQVSSLRGQVAAMKASVSSASAEAARASSAAAANRADLQKLASLTGCGTAIMVDLFHVTWRVVDAILGAFGVAPVFGVQAPIDDRGACAAVGVARTPQGAASGRLGMVPPLLDRLARLSR